MTTARHSVVPTPSEAKSGWHNSLVITAEQSKKLALQRQGWAIITPESKFN